MARSAGLAMKTVLITGSARRLGRSMALNFADSGWDVIIHHHSSDERASATESEIIGNGRKVYIVKADIRNTSDIKNMFDAISDNFSFPNLLINNSGIFPERKSINEISDEFWNNAINTNLSSVFNCSREFSYRAESGSRIINIASLGAFQIWKNRIPYNVSKAGVITLTKALARELAPEILVNSVSPGSILMADDPSPNDKYMISSDRIPMRRLGNTDDIFSAIYFFATCSMYITGQNINVDGGFHLNND